MTEKQVNIHAAIETESADRKAQVENVLGTLRDQLSTLSDDLKIETETRKSVFADMAKRMQNSSYDLAASIEDERFKRDTAMVALNRELAEDAGRVARKQKKLEEWGEDIGKKLMHAIKTEAGLRGATQASIVNSVGGFLQGLKSNLEREIG